MELQINDLVTSIRRDGIEAANKEAAEIIANAEEKAAAIVAKAKEDAQARLEAAEKEIAVLKESAELGAKQAQRDAMLGFKAEVRNHYERILETKVNANINGELLGTLIKAAIAEESPDNYTAEVSKLSDELTAALAEEIKQGLEIKANKNINVGFRLVAKDSSGYFDCSDEEIMRMLKPYFRTLTF